ncbi:MAG: sigma-70 family RNA polymerase sigma factor [Clostridia bacterium]|nr:sigma-70 family RNA polymerase sigma factor [Clostridia bacterium]
MEEAKLIALAQKGDETAFEQLVLLYQKRVYNLALRMVQNPDDAFDLSQEAFLKAWKNLPNLKADAAFSTWLFRMTSNECIDFLRRSKRQKTVSLTVESDDDEEVQLDMPDTAPGPEEAAIRAEEQALLQKAMEQLPPDHRQILTLRIVDDLDYRQISEVLGIAEGTVKSRLARARDNLRKNLAALGNNSSFMPSENQEGREQHAVQ